MITQFAVYFIFGIVLLSAIVMGFILLNFFGTWLRAKLADAPVSFAKLIGMRLRRVPMGLVVDSRITAVKAGINIDTDPLEAHYLAGGNVSHVVLALIAADKAALQLDFNRACAIDLAIKGTSKTVSNLNRFVGGATEDTIIARVGEGIITSIGSAVSYKDVLENPDRISKTVLAKGLDTGTAFEILSVDIADVDIGDNIGAKLQAEQAEADKVVAQAKAEMRRAAAVATEQEMKARTQEMQAKVVEAVAQVPEAISAAFRNGNLGVMDYMRLKNIQSDTAMRDSIATPPASTPA